MQLPEKFLLTNVGFTTNNQARISFAHAKEIASEPLLGSKGTLTFDTTTRYCTGWHDMKSGENYPCPEKAIIDKKYTECPLCQKRTGFNPAFYHAKTVSERQQARNAQPHKLYLAYFAPNVVKVGISYAGRGLARLLEQGARAAYILETFPSALIARQYEAKIAALDGIIEHLASQKKRSLLSTSDFDPAAAKQELQAALKHIHQGLGVTFSPEFLSFDTIYFPNGTFSLKAAHDRTSEHSLSGDIVAQIGSIVITEQNGVYFYADLKKYCGYTAHFSHQIKPIEIAPVQTTLF